MIASYSYPFAVEKCTTLAKNDELKLNVKICTNPAEQATAFAAIIIQNNDIDKKNNAIFGICSFRFMVEFGICVDFDEWLQSLQLNRLFITWYFGTWKVNLVFAGYDDRRIYMRCWSHSTDLTTIWWTLRANVINRKWILCFLFCVKKEKRIWINQTHRATWAEHTNEIQPLPNMKSAQNILSD